VSTFVLVWYRPVTGMKTDSKEPTSLVKAEAIPAYQPCKNLTNVMV
jgi:hypothetical protein